MISIRGSLLLLALVACGNSGKDGTNNTDASVGGGGPDAKQFLDAAPTTVTQVTISGAASILSTTGSDPANGVLIEAFRNSDESTRIAFTMTDSAGDYSLTIQTGGEAIDGFLKATLAGHKITYLYPPYPLTEDFDQAAVIMVTQDTYDTLSSLAQGDQMAGNALIGAVVTDGTDPLQGAMVTSSPAASVTRYNEETAGFVFPSSQAQSTHTDGVAYLFNVPPGAATVSATHPTVTLASHGLKAWADELTTTVIVP